MIFWLATIPFIALIMSFLMYFNDPKENKDIDKQFWGWVMILTFLYLFVWGIIGIIK